MQIIMDEIMPLVGHIKWDGFNKNSFRSIFGLQNKLIQYTNQTPNPEKLKECLALCIQNWPGLSECPISNDIIENAVDCIRKNLMENKA